MRSFDYSLPLYLTSQQIADLNHKLDKTSVEETMQIRRVDADASQHLTALDAKTRAVVEDIRNLINANRLHNENERAKLESSILSVIERTNAQRDARYVSVFALVGKHSDSLLEKIRSLFRYSHSDVALSPYLHVSSDNVAR